ncbi:type 4a pilus biogenesis protein PilO [Pelosinus sp. sgz500959]|uniref:type 4a pilus biogenesis protein PilO n=1 Tax=Pelosinus sp. sgz500959 TaxID=3242472 RepID=UPI00366C4DAF
MSGTSWKKIQVKHKISFFVIASVLMIYLFYDFLLLPQWTRRDELKTQQNLEQQQVQVVQSFVLAHPNAEQYLTELDRKITQVDMMLPDTPDISRFLLDIEQLSQESGVQLGYFKPGKIITKEGYQEIDIEFSVSGNYMQTMNFLNKAENGLRFINVTSIGIRMEKNTLESKLTAKIYSYGVPAVSTANNDKNTSIKK